MKAVVYTANLGGIDSPLNYREQNTNARITEIELVTYTDEAKPYRQFSGMHPRIESRFYKWMPHKLPELDGADYAIWVDSSANILTETFVTVIVALLGDSEIMCFRHPDGRDCIYQEAEFCSHWAKYVHQPMREQVEHYRSLGMPEHWGLYACGLVAYNMRKLPVHFLEENWYEMLKWSYHDQISVPYCCWRNDFKIKYLRVHQRSNHLINFFKPHNHHE